MGAHDGSLRVSATHGKSTKTSPRDQAGAGPKKRKHARRSRPTRKGHEQAGTGRRAVLRASELPMQGGFSGNCSRVALSTRPGAAKPRQSAAATSKRHHRGSSKQNVDRRVFRSKTNRSLLRFVFLRQQLLLTSRAQHPAHDLVGGRAGQGAGHDADGRAGLILRCFMKRAVLRGRPFSFYRSWGATSNARAKPPFSRAEVGVSRTKAKSGRSM